MYLTKNELWNAYCSVDSDRKRQISNVIDIYREYQEKDDLQKKQDLKSNFKLVQ